MAEIVSLSQCAIGIGPCCLKMSARALRREREREKKTYFHKTDGMAFSISTRRAAV